MLHPTTSIAARIPVEIAEQLAALAEKRNTTVSKEVRRVLVENVAPLASEGE
jgi:hypothetical protein